MSESPQYFIGASVNFLAAVFTLPLEYMKVHQQLAAADHKVDIMRALPLGQQAVASSGLRNLYIGWDAVFLRSFVYSMSRVNLYSSLVVAEASRDRYNSVPIYLKTYYGMLAGGVGALLANPFDMALVRLQTDNLLPEAQQRGYRTMMGAINSIATESGFFSLLTGASMNMGKTAMLVFGALSSYDQAKEWVARLVGDVVGVKFVASLAGGIIGGVFAMPFDNVKTKLQSQVPENLRYSGVVDCVIKTWVRESIWGFYVGYWMFVARFSAMFMITVKGIDYLRELRGE